jgi:signal transduction histidine kinase
VLYGGLFLACGAALLAITYTLVAHAATFYGPAVFARAPQGLANPKPGIVLGFRAGGAEYTQRAGPTTITRTAPSARPIPAQLQKLLATDKGRRAVGFAVAAQRGADLNQLEIESGIALGIMAIISGLLGWLVAGRVLRPLRTITATAQGISEANLHRRLELSGPRDELRQLADTIDGLLGRLEGAFDAQRRFVSNASHELRTPLTATRALVEMVLSDPHATLATFRETCHHVLAENEHQEQLIDALLTLAQGQRGVERRELVDLGEIVQRVVGGHDLEAAAHGVRLDQSLRPAFISADPRLIERLASNLVENAIRHNAPDGQAEVVVEARDEMAILRVTNTGPVIPAGEVDRLLQPFQRLSRERVGHGNGLGLGLSIVAAIATSHEAGLEVSPRPEGGLTVEVRFPLAASGGDQLALDDLSQRVPGQGADELHPTGTLEGR